MTFGSTAWAPPSVPDLACKLLPMSHDYTVTYVSRPYPFISHASIRGHGSNLLAAKATGLSAWWSIEGPSLGSTDFGVELGSGGVGVLVASSRFCLACGQCDAIMTTNPALHTDARKRVVHLRAQVSATR